MASTKVGDSVNVMQNGQSVKGKVTAVQGDGSVTVQLQDGTTIQTLKHVSSGEANYWHRQNTQEKLAQNQTDPKSVQTE